MRGDSIMDSPLISIVMPVYNAEKWIETGIQSVKNQSYEKWELIVVNDGSNDATLELCNKISSTDERIVIYNQKNKGPSAARNLGLSKIKGDYFLLIDCDDILPKDALKNYIDAAVENNADTVIGGFIKNNIFTSEKNVVKVETKKIFEINSDLNIVEIEMLLASGLMASNWNKLYKSSLAKIRFNEKLSLNEDVLFSLETLYNSSKVVVIPEIVYEYKIQNGNSVSLKFHSELPTALDCLEKEFTKNLHIELKRGIIEWLMNYLYVQLNIVSKMNNAYVEKKEYINEIINCEVFKKYGKIKYADTSKRKIAIVLLKSKCIYLYLMIMKMRK